MKHSTGLGAPVFWGAILSGVLLLGVWSVGVQLFAEIHRAYYETLEGVDEIQQLTDEAINNLTRLRADFQQNLREHERVFKRESATGDKTTDSLYDDNNQCQKCARCAMNCPRGPPGPRGYPGIRGTDGLPGVNGTPGAPGQSLIYEQADPGCITCPAGPPGLPGPIGPPGEVGYPGPKGERGADGLEGQPGPDGERGDPGEPGKPGDAGPPGIDGQNGVRGVGQPGAPGAVGNRGPPGQIGLPGVPARMGLPGLIGIPGPKGNDGLPGLEGVQGPDGDRGPPGPDGQYCPCPRRNSVDNTSDQENEDYSTSTRLRSTTSATSRTKFSAVGNRSNSYRIRGGNQTPGEANPPNIYRRFLPSSRLSSTPTSLESKQSRELATIRDISTVTSRRVLLGRRGKAKTTTEATPDEEELLSADTTDLIRDENHGAKYNRMEYRKELLRKIRRKMQEEKAEKRTD